MKKIKRELDRSEIIKNLNLFKKDRKPHERYASFDYCFNYFQGFKNKEEIAHDANIQNSCLQLGFYLASWGMYRGSTFLLQKSVKVFEPLVKYIASGECDAWGIDVDNYTEENIKKLISCAERIERELKIHETKNATDTLVTKIMLGVFGCVPAFDTYFKAGSNLGTFNKYALEQISFFYKDHHTVVDNAAQIKTLSYNESRETQRFYTKAKIIDMIFFQKGFEEDEPKKS